MHYCLADYLTVITPFLSGELVSATALSRIRAIAQTLKPTWGALLECHLSPDTSQVNFSVDLLDTALELDEQKRVLPIWQRIQELCWTCASPTVTDREVESVWLEFALNKEQPKIPIPSVFLSLQEGQLLHLSDNPAAFCCWLTEKSIEPLLGHTLPLKLQQNLQVCLKALPLGAQVLHVGVILPHPNSTIRLNISGIPPLELSNYLGQIGWSESVRELNAIALQLYNLVDRIVLNVDIDITGVTRVGLECFVDRHLARSSQWQPLLNYLVTSNLCTPEKCSALLNWSGYCHEKLHPVSWPRNLKAVSNFLGSRASSVLVRDLNHIELTLHPGNSWLAKGYLWFGADWSSSNKIGNSSSHQEQTKH